MKHTCSSKKNEIDNESAPDEENRNVPLSIPLDISFQEGDVSTFRRDGFVVYENVLDSTTVDDLNDRLEEILRGRYDRGQKPDKTPRLIRSPRTKKSTSPSNHTKTEEKQRRKNTATAPLGFSGNLQNVKVLQVINVHKSDRLFRALATSEALGKVVASLAGWKGARLAQDQIWAKPPGASPLVFHRDSPYFMFAPSDVVTVWVALDDMDAELGPLEYVKGSHRWGDGRVGSANQFFQSGNALLRSAAQREGLNYDSDLDICSMAGLQAGGISIHNGRTWHGSKKNGSKNRPRRGLGLHFVPANVRFTEDALKSRLWKPYVVDAENVADVMLPHEDFPVT